MAASSAVGADAPTPHFHPDHIMPDRAAVGDAGRADLHYVRASSLAQARLQVAVMSGNRLRAFEQIDRLVAIDKQLERLAGGEAALPDGGFGEDLDEQRLALASEKLALTAGIEMAREMGREMGGRMEPAFGGGMGGAISPDENVEIVEEAVLNRRLLRWAGGGFALLVLCFAVGAAVLLLL